MTTISQSARPAVQADRQPPATTERPATPVAAPKDLSIETLRGIAIILMVAGHVVGADTLHGLQVGKESGFRYFYYFFAYLRMPLFTVLSGYLYAMRPVTSLVGYRALLKGKARRLLWPFFTISTLQYLMNVLVPSTNDRVALASMWRIYVWPYGQFWFLYALAWIFLVAGALDLSGLLRDWRRWSVCLVACFALFISSVAATPLLSIDGFVRLLPYFLLGYGLQRHRERLTSPRLATICLAAFAVSFIMQQAVYFQPHPLDVHVLKLLSVCVGLPGIVLLFRWRRPIAPLAWIGGFAYTIYLFHIFGAAGTRIVLRLAGVRAHAAVFAGALAGGLLIPVLIEGSVMSHRRLRLALLGIKPTGVT